MAIPEWMKEVCVLVNGSCTGAGTGKGPSPPEGSQGRQDPLELGIAPHLPALSAFNGSPSFYPFPGTFG